MATERQIAANRANAKRSTGPKTDQGRHASSRNAVRHGLASLAGVRSRIPIDIDDLTEALVDQAISENPIVTARQAARAHIELLRIRAARTASLALLDLHRCDVGDLRRLLALDRYERLARGKRKRAANMLFSD